MSQNLNSPEQIAAAGEEIYKSLREQLEAQNFGNFVAINVRTGNYRIGKTPEEALNQARTAEPSGLFHLIRIGFAGAFPISYAFSKTTNSDWLSR